MHDLNKNTIFVNFTLNSTRKTSKATVVFSFGDCVLFGYLKWSEAQSVLSPCFIARQTRVVYPSFLPLQNVVLYW